MKWYKEVERLMLQKNLGAEDALKREIPRKAAENQ
jgi:hypothetical protein